MSEEIPSFSTERNAAKAMGEDTADGLIARVEESLENGLFDKEEQEEMNRILRTARLLATGNPDVIKKIDHVLANIENTYGK